MKEEGEALYFTAASLLTALVSVLQQFSSLSYCGPIVDVTDLLISWLQQSDYPLAILVKLLHTFLKCMCGFSDQRAQGKPSMWYLSGIFLSWGGKKDKLFLSS